MVDTVDTGDTVDTVDTVDTEMKTLVIFPPNKTNKKDACFCLSYIVYTEYSLFWTTDLLQV